MIDEYKIYKLEEADNPPTYELICTITDLLYDHDEKHEKEEIYIHTFEKKGAGKNICFNKTCFQTKNTQQ